MRGTAACIAALEEEGPTVESDREVRMPVYPAFERDACFDPIRRSPEFGRFIAELEPTMR